MTTPPPEPISSIIPCNHAGWRVALTDGIVIRAVPLVCWGLTVGGRVLPMAMGAIEVVPASSLTGFLRVLQPGEDVPPRGVLPGVA